MEETKKQVIVVKASLAKGNEVYKSSFDSKISHEVKLKEYSEKENIKINLDDKAQGYVWGKELAKLGNLVINIEGILAIAFIPNVITKNQYLFFKKAYPSLSKLHLNSVIYINEVSSYHLERQEGINVLEETYKIITKKYKQERNYYV